MPQSGNVEKPQDEILAQLDELYSSEAQTIFRVNDGKGNPRLKIVIYQPLGAEPTKENILAAISKILDQMK